MQHELLWVWVLVRGTEHCQKSHDACHWMNEGRPQQRMLLVVAVLPLLLFVLMVRVRVVGVQVGVVWATVGLKAVFVGAGVGMCAVVWRAHSLRVPVRHCVQKNSIDCVLGCGGLTL